MNAMLLILVLIKIQHTDRKLIQESKNKHESSPPEINSEKVLFVRCLANMPMSLPSSGEHLGGPDLGERGYVVRLLKRQWDLNVRFTMFYWRKYSSGFLFPCDIIVGLDER